MLPETSRKEESHRFLFKLYVNLVSLYICKPNMDTVGHRFLFTPYESRSELQPIGSRHHRSLPLFL